MMTASGLNLAHTAVYGALAVCILIILLIAKELLSAYGEEGEATRSGGRAAEEAEGGTGVTAKSLARNLSAAIYPLLFCFALIVVIKVMEVL
jgi:hypothetical protein